MVRLIIRDDDCNYFTRPEDLANVYSQFPDFPVSFAVVPMVTDVLGGCPETAGNTSPMFIGENKDLVAYLREKAVSAKCDILLHGITHGYEGGKEGKLPEMIWRNHEENSTVLLQENIALYKHEFERLFCIPINCFVAPSNKIHKEGIRAVYLNGMNYSGILPLSLERDLTFKTINNYVKRWMLRFVKRIPYPGVMDYGTHVELNACNTIELGYLKKMFAYCNKHNFPMAINVHYWHMRDFPERYEGFWEFINYAITNGAIPSRMRDCFE